MEVVAGFCYLIALIFLLSAALANSARKAQVRARRLVEQLEPTPIGSWRPGRDPVAARGFVDFGPAGPQTGPLTGSGCAWYRFTLVRQTSRSGEEGEVSSVTLTELESPAWAAFADGSGRVGLDPSMLDIKDQTDRKVSETTTINLHRGEPNTHPDLVPAKELADLDSEQWLILTEVRIPQGRVAYALGRVRGPGATLVPNDRGYSVFTRHDREEIVANRVAAAEDERSGAKAVLILGLVVLAAAVLLDVLSS